MINPLAGLVEELERAVTASVFQLAALPRDDAKPREQQMRDLLRRNLDRNQT